MSLSLAPPTGLEPVTSWLTVMRSTDWAMEEYRAKHPFGCMLCVGISLSSQAVTSQVFSAPLSLTSVFGMGTGGPSASSTPTILLYLKAFQLFYLLVTRAGIEPALPAWEAGVLTAWPTSHLFVTKANGHLFISPCYLFGAPSGARTRDTLIKSQVLYQLS